MALLTYKQTFVATMVNRAMNKLTPEQLKNIPESTKDELTLFYTDLVDQIILLIQSGDVQVTTSGTLIAPAVTGTAGTTPVTGAVVIPTTAGTGTGKVL